MTVLRGRKELAFDPMLPVLFLRTDHNVFHHGTLGAIRSLGRAGVEVHTTAEGLASPVAWSRYLHSFYPLRPWTGSPTDLVEQLISIALGIGRRSLLAPMDDAGAIFVAEHADSLTEFFVFPAVEPSLPRRLADKSLLLRECERLGISFPETFFPQSVEEVTAIVRQLGLPLIAKATTPWNLPKSSGWRSTVLVTTYENALRLWRAASEVAVPIMFQRCVGKEGGMDWFFQGYFDSSGRCAFGGVGRKDLCYPPGAGHTVLGKWLDNPEVERLGQSIAAALGYRGIADMDMRYEPDSSTYYLLDFNPRPGAQFRVFSAEDELDLVRALHLDLSGRAIPRVERRYGRVFVVENDYLRLRLTGRATGTSADFDISGGRSEFAWFAKDDPMPFIVMWARVLLRICGKVCDFLLHKSR